MLIKNKAIQILFLVSLGCIIMSFIEGIIQPSYVYKSLIKLIIFLSLILIYCLYNKDFSFFKVLKVHDKKDLLISITIGLAVYSIIILSYFIARNFIDLEQIAANLTTKENISRNSFIFVALYISFINSLLEELFFRGFAFIQLKELIKEKYAYIFSSISFALYHVFIMSGWFNHALFIFILFSLVIAGLIFDYFDRKTTIYNSWLIHMSANFAINTIGLIAFNII